MNGSNNLIEQQQQMVGMKLTKIIIIDLNLQLPTLLMKQQNFLKVQNKMTELIFIRDGKQGAMKLNA
jgi:hypothetical protein